MKDSAIVPEGIPVTLAGVEYRVKPVKYTRVFKLKRLIFEVVHQLDALDVRVLLGAFLRLGRGDDLPADASPEVVRAAADKRHAETIAAIATLDKLTDLLLENIGKILALGIPKIDAAIFTEDVNEELAPDIDEMWRAFEAILTVNHLEILKNQLANLVRPSGSETLPQTRTETPTTMPSPQLLTSMLMDLPSSDDSPSPN